MLLQGKPIVEQKIQDLKIRASKLERIPKLVIIRIGNDPASERYVNNKVKRCKEVGVYSEIIHLPENVLQSVVAHQIRTLNNNHWIDGILLQLPLPKHLDEHYLTNLIAPEKDVDGFTESNMGKLILGQDCNVACTPRGIIELLKYYDIPMEGQDVLIINRSNIVGKPLSFLMLKENATITIAHSKTDDLQGKIKAADIIVTAIGNPNAFYEDNFRPHQTIIDVSMNFDSNGRLCGDVCRDDVEAISNKGCYITPVPGGVGQMTVISLIEQTIEIAEKKEGNK